ncbi:MAG: GHKL domain-containing protein [Bacillota bacterium]|nr:GHKL domain-containing protein [Bacillota bacterium]
MIKSKQRLFLIIGLVLSVMIIFLPIIYTRYYHELTGASLAVNGTRHVSSEYKDRQNHRIHLDGQWVFYWQQLLVTEPEPLSQPDLIINVPDKWSKYSVDGQNLPIAGYGSYRLILTGLAYDEAVTSEIPNFGGAYRVFLDGQLAAKSGTLSKESDRIFTVPTAEQYPVILNDGTVHEVIIEVATTRFSGLYMTPELNDYQQNIREKSNRTAIRFILFGIALFSFISLLATYATMVRRKFKSLWLPVMIFFILIRIMLTSEFYGFWQPLLFFNLPYESTNELMYFTTFVMKYLLIFLVQEQCGIHISNRAKIGFLVYYALLYLIFLFIPEQIYNNYLSNILPALTYALDIYLFIKVYKGQTEIKKFGLIVFISAMLVIIGLTLDSFYISGIIYMNLSLALLACLSAFLLIMNWVYTLRVGDLYDDLTQTASRLDFAKSQITMQKQYYAALSEQMTEVREIKHDFRHIIGAMSRLADESRFADLTSFLNEYSRKTDSERLPVFCENIVANSIIGYYCLHAKEHGILFDSRCKIDRQNAISDSDLCIVLGNALENAIDACLRMKSDDSQFVSISMGMMNKLQLLKVKNSYSGELETIDGRYISSKVEKSHGFGLRNIEKVVESYGGFIKIEHNENEFTLMAAIPDD